ncbi:hypothetical protein [Streptomyces sp. NPDC008121]|uniref:hypothetical protein n=1 Tax=Streptomyces sp. NPDC008121 TaxID=3364809 RepID=UPI0036EB6FCE
MSFLRRAAAVSVLSVAVAVAGVAPSAFAASAAPVAAPFDGPFGGGHGERPLTFGPFEIPRNGQIGFVWGTSNR